MKTKKIMKKSMRIFKAILYTAIGYVSITNCQMEKMVTDDIKVPMKFTMLRVLPDGIHEEFW